MSYNYLSSMLKIPASYFGAQTMYNTNNRNNINEDYGTSDSEEDDEANTTTTTTTATAATAAAEGALAAAIKAGKKAGSKGWTPGENVNLFIALAALNITTNEGEKDPLWQSLVNLLQEKMSASTARPVSATRDHAKEMIQHCRTMNSWYSYLTTQDQHLPRCPSSTDAGFDDLFEDYCVNMWTMWKNSLHMRRKKQSVSGLLHGGIHQLF